MMRMSVRFFSGKTRRVSMLVVFIVDVRVVVVHRFVAMNMQMALTQEERDAECHERAGNDLLDTKRLGQHEGSQ